MLSCPVELSYRSLNPITLETTMVWEATLACYGAMYRKRSHPFIELVPAVWHFVASNFMTMRAILVSSSFVPQVDN